MFLSMAKQRSGCFIRLCYCPLTHALSIYDKSRTSSKFIADRPSHGNVTRGLAIALGPQDRRIMGSPSRGHVGARHVNLKRGEENWKYERR